MKPSQANTAWLLLPLGLLYASILHPFLSRRHLFGGTGENVEVKEEGEKTTFWLWLLTYIGRFVVVVVVVVAAAASEREKKPRAE